MSQSLQEHLEDAYDVDVEEQITLHALGVGPEAETDHRSARFVVDDEDKATWALRKLARIAAEDEAICAQYDREVDRLNGWLNDRRGPLERQKAFFEGLLYEFHQAQLDADPSKKTIKLPAGTLKSKAGQNRWTVDPEAFLEWFDKDPDIQAAHPDLVREKREAALSVIKQIFEPKDDRAIDPATGEIVAGVTVEPGHRTFTVEVAQ